MKITSQYNYSVPCVKTPCRATHSVSVRTGAYLKKVWCSMQTFHNRFEARWLGSLKPMVLSNCSYLAVVGGGVEVGEIEAGKWEEKEGERSECMKRWQTCGRVNFVYYAAMEKSMVFFCLLLEIYACVSSLPRQVDLPSPTNLKISRSCAHYIRSSVMWTEKGTFESISY